MKKYLAVFAALIVSLLLTACSSDDATSTSSEDRTSSTSSQAAEHNSADVMFAQMMIPHHQQAIEMADMVDGKQVSEELTALAEQIKQAQQPEIDTLTSWLKDWDEPVSDAPMDHGDGGMSGMMSQEDMDALTAVDGPEFEKMWLEMMIEHHEGAVEMAKTEVQDGTFQDAVNIAGDIIASQQDEIDQMTTMLEQ